MSAHARSTRAQRRARPASRSGPSPGVGGTAAFLRTALFVVLPILAALVALLTGFSLATEHWVAAGVLLIAGSALATLAWFGFRWWRHRRRVG